MGEEGLAAPGSANNQEPAAQAQKGLTLEEVRTLIDENTRPLHAEIRRLREGTQPKKTTEADRTLAARVQAIEEREQRLAERDRVDAIRREAADAGVAPQRLQVFVDHVLSQKGRSLVNQSDGSVGWVDLDPDNPKPMKELVSSFLHGPEGDMFRMPSLAPAGRGLRPNRPLASAGRAYADIPAEERLKMSLAERTQAARESFEQGIQ